MSQRFEIFIGYDPRQPVAYNVVAHSVATRLTRPVPITRLQLNQLPIARRGLTEFTYSRFLPPALCDYDGYSLFLDADMLVLSDVSEMLQVVDPLAAVSVVMHDAAFERPSLMLFNNKRCRVLTPEYVNDPAHKLFDFAWASKVGALPPHWNHVVGYNPPSRDAKVVHYTQGVPVWDITMECEWAPEWRTELNALLSTVSFEELMGPSVHVARMAAKE